MTMEPPLIPMAINNTLFLVTALFCARLELNMQRRPDRTSSIPPHLRWSPMAAAGTYTVLTMLAMVAAVAKNKSHWLSIALLLIGLIILGGALCHRRLVRL
jgi:hypothetical protein